MVGHISQKRLNVQIENHVVWHCHFTSLLIEMLSFYLFCLLPTPLNIFSTSCSVIVSGVRCFFFSLFLHSFQNLWTFLLNSWHFCLTCMNQFICMYVCIEPNQYSHFTFGNGDTMQKRRYWIQHKCANPFRGISIRLLNLAVKVRFNGILVT